MDRSRPDQILESWSAVANAAVRPTTAPRRTAVRSSLPGINLAGGALIVVALIVAGIWIGRPGADGGIGVVPTIDPSPSTNVAPTPAMTPTPAPSIIADGLFGDCRAGDLMAQITMWEGAAGSRIATVEMTYSGDDPCWIPTINKVQLLDATGAVRIDGLSPLETDGLQLSNGEVATTLVRTDDYCGPTVLAPISLAFWSYNAGLVVASPHSSDDATMPPCNSQSGSGQIEMQPWVNDEGVIGSCAVADLDAAITSWEGAAGSRIATVEMTYAGSADCWIPSTSGLRLVDATGAVLIYGDGSDSTARKTVIVGDRLTTLVRTSNYCSDAPVAPVTVAFVADGSDRVTAAPYSATDATVPPCNGPGQPATIEMQSWTR